jgi:heat shock protein HslJ
MIASPCAYTLSCTALLLALVACGGGNSDWVVPTPAADQTGEQIHITGVVRYSELEGGFYAIRGADGITYNPTNLPAEFRKDGLPVEADARRRNDVVGIHQVGPIVQLVRIRARGATGPAAGGAAPAALWGTAWVLEDLGGAGVLEGVQATLEFPEPGKAAGRGSCNRFFGTVEIAGESLTFGPLGSTKMACDEAVMTQEGRYLEALQHAERYAIQGSTLLIYPRGMNQPLRFTRKTP